MTDTAAPLPRAHRNDRRTAAQRTPHIPVTIWVRTGQHAQKVHTAVGDGGWSGDATHAAARALNLDPTQLTVTAIQGGHH